MLLKNETCTDMERCPRNIRWKKLGGQFAKYDSILVKNFFLVKIFNIIFQICIEKNLIH